MKAMTLLPIAPAARFAPSIRVILAAKVIASVLFTMKRRAYRAWGQARMMAAMRIMSLRSASGGALHREHPEVSLNQWIRRLPTLIMQQHLRLDAAALARIPDIADTIIGT
jgi:hypothetical protein